METSVMWSHSCWLLIKGTLADMPMHGDEATDTIFVSLQHRFQHTPATLATLRPPLRGPRRIGYARLPASADQATVRGAVDALLAAGVESRDLYLDCSRAPAAHRPAWRDLLQGLRAGDTLACPAPTALARSSAELDRLLSDLNRRGVTVELDGRHATVREPHQLLESLRAELVVENTIRQAHWDGRVGRHPRALNPAQEAILIEAFDTAADRRRLAAQAGVSRATLYRIATASGTDVRAS